MSEKQNKETEKDQNLAMTPERRKRINRLKKIIIRTVLFMILFPVTICVVLGIQLYQADKSEESLMQQIGFLEQELQKSEDAVDRTEALLEISEEIYKESEVIQVVQVPENMDTNYAVSANDIVVQEGVRKVYLTFDDGPSIYTDELLDILAKYDVKATFFVTGKDKAGYRDTYRRIVEEGHTLGMHSYSHEYENIYASLENFQQDVGTLRNYLYNETGVGSKFYRFPGGSSNKVSDTDIEDMTAYLNAMGIRYFDWNITAGDATGANVTSDEIVERVMSQLPLHQVAVVLMHDAKDKRATVDALPKLIEAIQGMEDGTLILPITEETMLIQHKSG